MSAPAREEYVRVKRKNQTFFIHCAPSDTFAQIKSEISLAMGSSDVISSQKMRLYIETPKPTVTEKKADDDQDMGGEKSLAPKGPIPDEAILSDHDVKNDAVLFVTFANSWEGGDATPVPEGDDSLWEEIDIVKP